MNDAHGLPQNVLVLGGSSEIAGAVLDRLVARRARRIVLAGRDVDAMGQVSDRLVAAGAEEVAVARFDAEDPASHTRLFDDAFRLLGEVDLVLFAFGVLGDQAAALDDPNLAASVAQVNYVAAVRAGVDVARRLRAQGYGNIVALSSVAGERPRRSNFVYGSSKAGMDAFFTGLGDDVRGSGVRVMVVRPGFVHTRMTAGLRPAPFSTTPDAVAGVIVRGLATGAETVWAPSPLRWVMGVLRHLPRPLFRRLPL